MKEFLKTWAVCIVVVFLFMTLVINLLDMHEHIFLTVLFIAFLLAVWLTAWLHQQERIEKLEEEIEALKHKENEQ